MAGDMIHKGLRVAKFGGGKGGVLGRLKFRVDKGMGLKG